MNKKYFLLLIVFLTVNIYHCLSQSPGGVTTDLSLWLKSNNGISQTDGQAVDSWSDQSGNGNNASQATAASQPILNSNTINFNAGLNFQNDFMLSATPSVLGIQNSDYEIFAIYKSNTVQSGNVDSEIQFITSTNDTNAGHFEMLVNNGTFGDHGFVFLPLTSQVIGQGVNGDYTNQNPYLFFGGINADVGNTGVNGLNVPKITPSGVRSSNNAALRIGSRNSNGEFPLNGVLSELIIYSSSNTTVQRNQIQSYLSLKYGITLDQTSATAYIASDGTTKMWDETLNTSYNNDIFGVGRDDNSGLNQKIAKSINTGAVFTVALDNDFTVANNDATRTTTFSSDLQFLTFANDGGATTTQTTELNTTAYNMRITREWQVQNVGSVGAVNVKFEGFGGYDVLSDTDGDFSTTGDQTVLGKLDANGELTGVTFTNGAYITLAFLTPSPGGVLGSLEFWVKANGDVTVSGGSPTDWNDETNKHTGEIVSGGGAAMTYTNDGHNFNPYVTFNGNGLTSGQFFNYGADVFLSGATSAEVFSVVEAGVGHTVDGGFPYQFAGNAGSSTQEYDFSNGHIFDTFGATFPGLSHNWNPLTPPIGSAVEIQDPHIYNTHSATNDWAASFDGALNYTSTTNTTNFASRQSPETFVGAAASSVFNGNISEVILHNNKLTDQERQRVNSYLSLKYGITLDQTSATAYLASDGTTKMWDETLNTSYNNDIFGIGRDDNSALNQKVAKSINAGAIFTVALDNNFIVANNDAARTAT
ncbi:hypothetical protein, partial [Tenacibaculum amylolyticum]|uniref:hypothetical protein n=1 Tax=Tenacibaculum amylolyticum TaxID=104269 RepID=UPI0038B613B8